MRISKDRQLCDELSRLRRPNVQGDLLSLKDNPHQMFIEANRHILPDELTRHRVVGIFKMDVGMRCTVLTVRAKKEYSSSGSGLAASYVPESVGWYVERWGQERQHFTPGIFPNVSKTGNWKDVGHYTAMIWRTTKEVGCGPGCGSTGRYPYIFVCQYAPPGNVVGKPVF